MGPKSWEIHLIVTLVILSQPEVQSLRFRHSARLHTTLKCCYILWHATFGLKSLNATILEPASHIRCRPTSCLKKQQTFQPIRRTTLSWEVTCHQYGISALVAQTSFGRENSSLHGRRRKGRKREGEKGEGIGQRKKGTFLHTLYPNPLPALFCTNTTWDTSLMW